MKLVQKLQFGSIDDFLSDETPQSGDPNIGPVLEVGKLAVLTAEYAKFLPVFPTYDFAGITFVFVLKSPTMGQTVARFPNPRLER